MAFRSRKKYSPEPFEKESAPTGTEEVGYTEEVEVPARKSDFAFKVRNLTKDYDGNVVLNNISFDIPSGKIVGLL